MADVAAETIKLTPTVLDELPHLRGRHSERLELGTDLPALDPAKCPGFLLPTPGVTTGTPIKVVNADTFDAAISMTSAVFSDLKTSTSTNSTTGQPATGGASATGSKASKTDDSATTEELEADLLARLQSVARNQTTLNLPGAARVAVLNMANETSPGGGWLNGATAQEEALCYRSTLAASFHRKTQYPLPTRGGLYTRDVVIFRTSMGDGHKLMVGDKAKAEAKNPKELPVVSVLSVAGVKRPDIRKDGGNGGGGSAAGAGSEAGGSEKDKGKGGNITDYFKPSGSGNNSAGSKASAGSGSGSGSTGGGRLRFAKAADRELTKDKMRLCLRMAAARGHTMLVLGALGCGAFKNPPEEVADCWMEVFAEQEFAGGWFKEIWFAVYDRRNEGNFEIFRDMFDGKIIGQKQFST